MDGGFRVIGLSPPLYMAVFGEMFALDGVSCCEDCWVTSSIPGKLLQVMKEEAIGQLL